MFEFTSHPAFAAYERGLLEADSEIYENSYFISVSSFLLWTFLYCLLWDTSSSCKPEKDHRPEFACRAITLTHAITSCLLATYITFVLNKNPDLVQCNNHSTKFEAFCVAYSLGYFVFDLFWCLFHSIEGWPMLIHHILAVTTLSTTLYVDSNASEVVIGLMGSEFTSTILNVRWFLKHKYTNYSNSKLGRYVDVLFVFAFICVRMIIGGIYLCLLLRCDRCNLTFKIGSFLFYLINVVFCQQIIGFARHRFRKITKR